MEMVMIYKLLLPISFVSLFALTFILPTRRSPALQAGEPKAGAVKKIEIADKVFMEFCYIPPGEVKLGSTADERSAIDRVLINHADDVQQNPGWLTFERNEKRGTFKSKGFWLGKYEVTQGEWKALMGTNPSRFGVSHDKIKEGVRIDRFPVNFVQRADCQKFLENLNKLPGIAKTFGNLSKCVLPHEDEWEYAYRGGRGNDRPFYWGNELNGTQANCWGDFPFGTDKKGQFLRRMCEVDDTNEGKYESHPWGLCHMSGNVWEYCGNKDSDGNFVQCGGSWLDEAWTCRAASRYRGMSVPPQLGGLTFGFRVCVRLE